MKEKAMAEPLLSVKNLRTYFYTKKGVVRAVDGVDFDVEKGEVLGIVGESGCGKSVTAMSILRLLSPYARIEDGSEICFEGKNLVALQEKELREVRGKDIAMIFQDPMTSLNPVMKIGRQLEEVSIVHGKRSKVEAKKRALEMLYKVGIPSPEKRIDEYPHQLSGGMKQRVMIAMALMESPKLLIADEPTTALDVTIQAQILDLLCFLQEDTGTSIMLITHDMGVVASMSDHLLVMYAGQGVEYGKTEEVFNEPKHPYTRGLLKSIPSLDSDAEELFSIQGTVPNQYACIGGCPFHPRCPCAIEKCARLKPEMEERGNRRVRCWMYD